jgi:hypothetical protein
LNGPTSNNEHFENDEKLRQLVHTYSKMTIRMTAPREVIGSHYSISEAISEAKTGHSDDTSFLASQFDCM